MPRKPSKYCVVPMCKNTRIKYPEKLFINVPNNPKRRSLWLQMSGRIPGDLSTKSTIYMCEDHFNLEEDMENYMEFKMMGGNKRMKPDAVPRKFDCQIRKKITHSKPNRSVLAKRRIIEPINKLLEPTTSSFTPSSSSPPLQDTNSTELVKSIGIQVEVRPSYSSKYTQSPEIKTADIQCSPIKICSEVIDATTSPLKINTEKLALKVNSDCETSSSSDAADEKLEKYTNYSTDLEFEQDDAEIKLISVKNTLFYIEKRPMLYLGIPSSCYCIISILQKYIKTSYTEILVVLKKIRTDLTYVALGDDFGMSSDTIRRIFPKNIPILSAYCRHLIKWNSSEKIAQNLPISFRCKVAQVQSIIHCFEIEIEKPSDSIKQSLTWSEYKKCNTVKYLVSCTPDGLINFISKGFGGRTSDTVIVEASNFIESVPHGAAIMADRGFKHIEELLRHNLSKLVRPPSVFSSTRNDVLLAKQVASQRIHVERVISRLREFNMLRPHAVLNNQFLRLIDEIVVIVCGLVNLQQM